jgi:ureidoglycolate hydrolase
MINIDNINNEKFEFRGNIIESNYETIKILNYALALNGSEDRYKRIQKNDKNKQKRRG